MALGKMTVAHDTGTAVLGLQISMLGEEIVNLGLDGSWLKQLGDGIVRRHIAPSVEK